MPTFRTSRCSAAGHPEVTLQLAHKSPIPGVHELLIDYFEAAVARGTKFSAGQTVQLGWSVLKLCERADGTLGVQERELTPEVAWTESVDRALRDVWMQREIAASVGLLDELAFPRQDDGVLVADCARTSHEVLLTRVALDDAPPDFSGWLAACAHQEHDHGERVYVPLLAIAADHAPLVQLLALPHGTSVLVLFRAKPNAPAGQLRIEPHVFRDGEEIIPARGSYLAALQA